MKKLSVVIGVLILSVFLTGTAFGQMKNTNAYFVLDNNLASPAYQSLGDVKSIGGNAKVGFAIYAKEWQEAGAIKVRFDWDGTLAEYISAESGLDIVASNVTINGSATALAAESNIVPGLTSLSETSDPVVGNYENDYALIGGAPSTTAAGLVFFAVFKTSATFTTQTWLRINATVTIKDGQGNELLLGTRYFYVNASNDPMNVKPATWKEVKEQFKDF